MSARSRRLRRARPCYSCGFVARHYRDNGGAVTNADPCSCRACLAMPVTWRTELRERYERKLGDRAYHNAWARRWGEPLDTTPIEPVELDAYAWPGGYQIMYYVDGDPVCPKCIMEVLRETYLTGREEILRDVFYEGAPETCSHCGEEIESAYGDPGEPDEDEAAEVDEDDANPADASNEHDPTDGDPHVVVKPGDAPGYGF